MTTAIFWPMIVQAMLVYAIYALMSRRRFEAVRDGEAKADDFRVPRVEPERSATVARNLANQFELPVLFFVVCLSLQITAGVTYLALVLAWIFVASRVAHAAVHVTSNRLRYRRPLFVVGYLANLGLWLLLALHLLALA
jgi:Uncharacterized protein conserved in bacteria